MKILSEPFEQCHASFEHISFEEHIKTLVELSNSLKEFTMMPTQYKDLIFRFDYINKLMIPICCYLCLYSEHLSFALLKYSYMMMLSLTNHNHNNFISHLIEINGIYYFNKDSLQICESGDKYMFLGKPGKLILIHF